MTPEEKRIYYEGFAAGEGDINADWTCAMTEIAGLPDDFDVTPTKVAEFIKRISADASRYHAWRDGEVIVRQNDNGLWEARHRDSSHWDIFSWYVSPSLDEAIDAAIGSDLAKKRQQ